MEKNLLPIGQISKIVKTSKIHLAYLTKLGLLPQSVRRKIEGKMTGCYPDWVLSQIRKVEDLKNSGMAYSQIKTPAPVYNLNPLALLIIGLLIGYLLALNKPATGHQPPDPIYLIPAANHDFYRLGTIPISDLIK